VPQEFYGKDGPLTDPNKDQSQPTFDYLPGIDAPPAQQGQTASQQDIWETGAPPFDTLGVAAPTVDNPNAVGSLSAPGVPGFDYGVPGAVASQLSDQPAAQQAGQRSYGYEKCFPGCAGFRTALGLYDPSKDLFLHTG
jgi:hypothetical protein